MYPDQWEIRSQGSAREAGSTARLICLVCGYEEPVPKHCRDEMIYRQKGSFRRLEYLVCPFCGYEEPVPRHCGIPMLYATTSYIPISPLTEKEIEECRKYYNNKG